MNQFLDKKWLHCHYLDVIKKADKRYTPKLNVDLPISEIFNGIQRSNNFYDSIRKQYGEFIREWKFSIECEEQPIVMLDKVMREKMALLLKSLSKIKIFNVAVITWESINEQAITLKEIVRDLYLQLRDVKDSLEKQKKTGVNLSKFDYALSNLNRVLRDLEYLEELSISVKAQLSNKPFLLLLGDAGIGKTHLLCDVIENTLNIGQAPAILAFGEFFVDNNIDFWGQLIEQLKLPKNFNKDKLFKRLDQAGKEKKSRSLLIIDALNETKSLKFWQKKLKVLCREIKKYPHVGLVVSIRSGFDTDILNNSLKKNFIQEVHFGFKFKEWEAVTKFFKEYSLPLPEIPVLMPEFENPLFLKLLCEAFQKRSKKRNKEIFRGHEGATYIFESFVKSKADKIAKEFGLKPGKEGNKHVIWDTIIERVAEEMVEQNSDRISTEKLDEIIKTVYPVIDYQNFKKQLEKNMLLTEIPRYSADGSVKGFDFKFPFQKFSDHLIGRYIFKKYEVEVGKKNKSFENVKKFFSRKRKLGKYLSNSWGARGIIEALSIQCPEYLNGLELVEIAPYLLKEYSAKDGFVQSIIWRKPTAFKKDIKDICKNINWFIKNFGCEGEFFDASITIASVPNHPLNANFLHKMLLKIPMPKRDAFWSIYLHDAYGQKSAIDRIIAWCYSQKGKLDLNIDSMKLIATMLVWFLTSTNKMLRDNATKALVILLTDQLWFIQELLEKFDAIDDAYVLERLYAVAYGCALRNSKDYENIEKLAYRFYDKVFKSKQPPEHILLRDYAKGVIERALIINPKLKIDHLIIAPPYNSRPFKKPPTIEEIKGYQLNDKAADYYLGQNYIISSMQPDHSELYGGGGYGDFGRYIFQSTLSNWKITDLSIQQLSNIAVKRVFELGYDVNLHGYFDRRLGSGRANKEPGVERIGKKYQWIAFYELAGRVSDHYDYNAHGYEDESDVYLGPWQVGLRNIDPSCILKNDKNDLPQGLPSFNDQNIKCNWMRKISDTRWIKISDGFPSPLSCLEFRDNSNTLWVMCGGSYRWEEDTAPEYKKYQIDTRAIHYLFNNYMMKATNAKKFKSWARKQDFMGGWMPDSHSMHNIFLGEYPNVSKCMEEISVKEIPVPILLTDNMYSASGLTNALDSETLNIALPAGWLIQKMVLENLELNGCFYKDNVLIAFDPSIFYEDMPKVLLFRKEFLCKFLDQEGYSLFWTVVGEKNMIGGNYLSGERIGRHELTGVCFLDSKNRLKGSFKTKFEK